MYCFNVEICNKLPPYKYTILLNKAYQNYKYFTLNIIMDLIQFVIINIKI